MSTSARAAREHDRRAGDATRLPLLLANERTYLADPYASRCWWRLAWPRRATLRIGGLAQYCGGLLCWAGVASCGRQWAQRDGRLGR